VHPLASLPTQLVLHVHLQHHHVVGVKLLVHVLVLVLNVIVGLSVVSVAVLTVLMLQVVQYGQVVNHVIHCCLHLVDGVVIMVVFVNNILVILVLLGHGPPLPIATTLLVKH